MAKDANQRDIAAGRLTADEYAANFADLLAPLNRHQAVVEADRPELRQLDDASQRPEPRRRRVAQARLARYIGTVTPWSRWRSGSPARASASSKL